MTDRSEVQLAIDAGADYFGMIFAPSPRRISWESARDIANKLNDPIIPVAVFVDPQPDEIDRVLNIFPNAAIQLCGNESPQFVRDIAAPKFKVVHVGTDDNAESLAAVCERYAGAMILFDTVAGSLRGGSGETFVWERVALLTRGLRGVIAGGLTPENVGACIRSARPYGVDVRSGVERDGSKDVAKMRAFLEAVRAADAA